MQANYQRYVLNFKQASGTSRGVLLEKETWFIFIEHNGKKGIGECGILRGLSIDDRPDYEEKLQWTCENIALGKDKLWEALLEFPSIQFGVEMAFLSLESIDKFELFSSRFTQENVGMNINGLVWMGEKSFMKEQIISKLEQGFSCIKLKIGAINFEEELSLLKFIRENFDAKTIEIRLDANGAFALNEVEEKLKKLSQYQIHSIEQPVKQGNWEKMADLCQQNIIPIALDEELIGVFDLKIKEEILTSIKPPYIILKPSLIGGIKGSNEWINLAEKLGINWWITSALESNIGLNAIAQYTYTLNNPLPQGLGTGGLYTNNFDSPLEIKNGKLYYKSNGKWEVNLENGRLN
jgi:O-succinylbenzoate synthase